MTKDIQVKHNQYIDQIENYIPGSAKINSHQVSRIIKLSSNENALKSSEKAILAYQQHFNDIFRYADGSATQLRQAIANKYKIDANKIMCGAGSDEIISLIATGFASINDEIIYSEYGFLMYPIAAKRVGAKAVKAKESNYKTDINSIISSISNKTKIIFIANPNNPTGSYLNDAELNILINNIPPHILLVLDCAYDEYVVANDYPNAFDLVNKHSNVILSKTFSKAFGLASLRIGWCYGHQQIIDVLNKIRGPFNVGGPAQFAAIAAINDDDFILKSRNHNQKWLSIFYKEIANFNRIKAYPSVANFILLDFLEIDNAKEANRILLANGVILREMNGYNLPSCMRMTIGTDEENEIILELLREINSKI
jgi:histidinol-phosphate aminotransferase